ncbi:hypothetical protein BI364_10185 [Acidihalobacter yilgarnensis]|uniref:DUF4400 domain-containing protein n=1 Tax=Acidihalobacter yilgarnensis TaxID=2819280 RepID=A0A1D8IP45_9GAMM|nr:DUF4400 domain-containing protein [Acidihalobacter yilgarnensis]AOU98280.1 hypothetical protein BI364_10185 [Acidihalobacter yilgarnensis]
MAGGGNKGGGFDRKRKLVGIWLVSWIAIVLFAPLPWLEVLQHAQETATGGEMGLGTVAFFDHMALHATRAIYASTGLANIYQQATGFFRERLESGYMGLYLFMWRLFFFMGVAILFSPVLAGALFDGMIARRILQWRYEYTSTARHTMARSTVLWAIDLALLLVALPIPLPPAVVISGYLLVAISLRWWAASMQKRI